MMYFESAKEKDPEYALAYAGISDVWIGFQQMGIVPPSEAGPKIEEAAMKALELDSTHAEAHAYYSHFLNIMGRPDEAMEIWRKYFKNPEYIKAIDEGYAEGGFPGANKKLADIRTEQSNTVDIPPMGIAYNYALAGDIDNAIYWLEKAYEEHDPGLPYLLHSRYDKLRDDPRFQELARRMKLPYK